MTPRLIIDDHEPEAMMTEEQGEIIVTDSLYVSIPNTLDLYNVLPRPKTPTRKNKRFTKKTSFVISSDEYINTVI